MSGYIGTKAVLLSTTAASVTGNADIGGDLTVDTSTLFVDSTNNRVGVGTSSPSAALDVLGASGDQLRLRTAGTEEYKIGRNASTGLLDFYGTQTGYTGYTFGGINGERMRIDSSGNVGIGTSASATKLEVLSGVSNSEIARFGSTVSSRGLRISSFAISGTNEVGYDFNAPGNGVTSALSFSTLGSERMRIDASGNLLVGTTTTAPGVNNTTVGSAIQSGGTFCFSSNAITGYVNRNADGSLVTWRRSGAEVGSISITTSATSYNTSSDYRLKEDVQPMTGASDRVLALNPVNFAWKADGTRVDGFLAHEAQAVVPEAVTGTKDAMRTEEYEVTPAVEATYDEDGNELTPYVPAVMGTREVPDYQGIDQSKLTPLLTAALQEALKRIEALEVEMQAMKDAGNV